MSGISFEVSGADELVRQLERVEKKFPYTTKKVLEKETRNIAKDLKKETAKQIKKHGMQQGKRKQDMKRPVYLEKSYQPGRVRKAADGYRDAVTSRAPHYHLVERGHEPGGWHGWQKDAVDVKGRKIVASYMAKRSRYAHLIGEEILNEVLNEAAGN